MFVVAASSVLFGIAVVVKHVFAIAENTMVFNTLHVFLKPFHSDGKF